MTLLADAQVQLRPTGLTTKTSTAGAFAFTGLNPGSYNLIVRALGYQADSATIVLRSDEMIDTTIRLRLVAQSLAPLTVAAEAPRQLSATMRAFEERRRGGLGRFLTREELALREHSALSDILRQTPGLRLVRRPPGCGGGHAAATGRGGFVGAEPWMACLGHGRGQPDFTFPVACYLTIYLDGARQWSWGNAEPIDIDQFSVVWLQAVELYRGPSELPAAYQTTGSACGAVLLWTRTGDK